jgi:hypothetical protein
MGKFRIAWAVLAVTAIVPIVLGGGVASASTPRPGFAPVHSLRPVPRLATDSPYYLCADYIGGVVNKNECVNPSSSTFSSGEVISVGSANYGIDVYDFCTVGYVSGDCTPFNAGSDCNTFYKGFIVWLLEWNANKSYFMRNEHTDSNQVLISQTDDVASEWLYGYTSSGVLFLTNVAATNDAGITCTNNDPGMVLTYRPNTTTVFSESYGSYDASKQSWSFTGF